MVFELAMELKKEMVIRGGIFVIISCKPYNATDQEEQTQR